MKEQLLSLIDSLTSIKFDAFVPIIIIVVYVLSSILLYRNKNTREMIFRLMRVMRGLVSTLFILDGRLVIEDSELESKLTSKLEKEIIQDLLDKGLTRKILTEELSRYCVTVQRDGIDYLNETIVP